MNPEEMNVQEESSEPKTMSLLGGIARPEGVEAEDDLDFAAIDGEPKRGMNRGSMLIAIIVALASGTFWLMRVSQGDLGSGIAQEIEAKIDQALVRLSNPEAMADNDALKPDNLDAMFADTDTVLAMFSGQTSENRVPIEFLKKNPFTLPMVKREEPQVTPDLSEFARQRALEKQRAELQAEARKLKLQTVVGGQRPVAVINGEVLRPGQSIGRFTLVKIENLVAVMQAENFEFQLTMEDPAEKRRR